MALNDNANVVAATGFLFFGDVGIQVPANWEDANLAANPSELVGMENVGHTSLEDLPEFGSDGGDSETLGSWQRKVLRQQQTEASTDYLTFQPYQFDRNVLEMYWGIGETTAGRFDIVEVGARKLEKSFLVVIVDGAVRVAFFAPRVSFSREDSLSLSTENFAQWPIRATFLQYQDQPLLSFLGDEIQPADTEPAA